uniref:Glycoprotein endo-alpha-1,2-mannosidase n=1 Tax=Hippocampus comes TaxID=109280 RepID=A0A3Q2ZNY8_HIPCM
MPRFRRKSCVALLALALLVLIVTFALKSLAPEDTAFTDGKEISPYWKHDAKKTEVQHERPRMSKAARPEPDEKLMATLSKFPPPNYYLHAFYYIWYGNPSFDRLGGGGLLEPIPVAFRQDEQPSTLTLTPRDNLECSISLPCMFLECGRQPEYPEKTHAAPGRTCKLHTGRPELELNPVSLYCEVVALTTGPLGRPSGTCG